jgi:hypothetical protein
MKKLTYSLVICALGSQAFADVTDSPTQRAFYTPSGACKLILPKGEFFIAKEQVRPNGATAYYVLANEKRLINYSFFIETNTSSCDSDSKCLDSALSNKAYEKAKDLKKYDYAGFSIAEFNIEFPGKDGATLIQQNILAQSYKPGCWIDAHLSQVGLKKPDVDNILSVLKDSAVQR